MRNFIKKIKNKYKSHVEFSDGIPGLIFKKSLSNSNEKILKQGDLFLGDDDKIHMLCVHYDAGGRPVIFCFVNIMNGEIFWNVSLDEKKYECYVVYDNDEYGFNKKIIKLLGCPQIYIGNNLEHIL